jgi:hypothetical protein
MAWHVGGKSVGLRGAEGGLENGPNGVAVVGSGGANVHGLLWQRRMQVVNRDGRGEVCRGGMRLLDCCYAIDHP